MNHCVVDKLRSPSTICMLLQRMTLIHQSCTQSNRTIKRAYTNSTARVLTHRFLLICAISHLAQEDLSVTFQQLKKKKRFAVLKLKFEVSSVSTAYVGCLYSDSQCKTSEKCNSKSVHESSN